uniref:Uncharacterized protein n=1 Tax=Myotis myotis TaxID=51298 RepID=A0A7J7UPQ6_MYOMY|nr:hypothetical protein mMyoMyo1_008648 [Myotis myotis]
MCADHQGACAEHDGRWLRWDGAGSKGTRPSQGTSRCHQGEPLVVTENSLLPRDVVLPGTRTCCQCQPHSHPLPAPDLPLTLTAGPNLPSGLLHLHPLLLSGNQGRHLPLAPAAGDDPLAPTVGAGAAAHIHPCAHCSPVATVPFKVQEFMHWASNK